MVNYCVVGFGVRGGGFRKWWFGGVVYLKVLEIFVCFYYKDFFIIFCGNFILFGKKRIRKKKIL